MPTEKILIVEDDLDIADILQFNLENENYIVTRANSAEEALELNLLKYDLILLDVMMQEMNGFKFAEKLKADIRTTAIPIIFLTARITESDILTGLKLGAEDYIIKPFSLNILLAKIKNVLQRASSTYFDNKSRLLEYHDLKIDTFIKKVTIKDKEIELTKTEFELLLLLFLNPNYFFNRNEILNHIWKDACVVVRTVDVHIARLRKKILPYGEFIVGKSGYGYSFVVEKDE